MVMCGEKGPSPWMRVVLFASDLMACESVLPVSESGAILSQSEDMCCP